MAGVIVGGVTIPVAPSGISRNRLDAVDRARAFDNTYRASATGTAKRDFVFSTPPLLRGAADYYEGILSVVTAQSCYGDVLGNNQLLWSNDFTNALWVKTTITVTPNIADPFGGMLASTLTATAANSLLEQNQSVVTSGARTNSIWIRRRTGSGTVQLIDPGGNLITQTLTTSWARFPVMLATTFRSYGIKIVTSADAIDAYGGQKEEGSTASTYNETTTVPAPISCCAEVTGWSLVKTADAYRVVLGFQLHEV